MTHDHRHAAPAAAQLGRTFALGIGLNVAFVVAELVAGVCAHSTALVADAVHNASDVLGLGLAWGAAVLARRKPSLRHTYGLRASTVLAALANAVLLLIAVGGVSWEAIQRLASPSPVDAGTILGMAAVGVVINAASALLFLRGRQHDTNVRAAFLHLASDAGVYHLASWLRVP
jgi:cobalt-zinc-cadmium efflux system protein